MDLTLLLVLSIVLLGVGIFAVVKRLKALAVVTLSLGLLGVLAWILETSGIVNL